MANHLKMGQRERILDLFKQGWSKRKIARELQVDRGTVRLQLRASGHADGIVSTQNSNPPTPSEVITGSGGAGADSKPKPPTPGEVITGSDGVVAKTAGRSKCEPYRRVIEEKIAAGLSAQRIFQDLRDEYEFQGHYHSVRRMVRRLAQSAELPYRRLECEPGAQAQADFGRGAPIFTADGQHRTSHVLRVVLSHSRKAYSEAFYRQDTESWLAGLENAFWAWGGVPKTLQIDNTRAAVSRADWYDPEVHPIITAFCRHYGTVLLPIKAGTPRHNGKAERNVGYAKDNGLKGRTFPTLSAENEHLLHWESQVADLRVHGTTKKQVRQLFESERPALRPLPPTRFTFFHEGKRIVHRDGHVEVAQSYYSVPPEYLGHTVWVRWDSRLVRVLNRHFVEIALHARAEPGRFATLPAHLSSKKIALVEHGATALLRRVRLIGPQAARWAEAVLKERGIAGVRVLVGLLALAKRHSRLAVEKACELACAQSRYYLRHLRAQLKDPVEQEQFEFMAEHPIIRGLHHYGTLVNVRFGADWHQPPAEPPQEQQNDGPVAGRIRNGTDPASD